MSVKTIAERMLCYATCRYHTFAYDVTATTRHKVQHCQDQWTMLGDSRLVFVWS